MLAVCVLLMCCDEDGFAVDVKINGVVLVISVRLKLKGLYMYAAGVLHILHICFDFLGDEEIGFCSVNGSSCSISHSHCAVLHIQVCSCWFYGFSTSRCKRYVYRDRENVKVQWL